MGRNGDADVIVVGAGGAGLVAAITAADEGARVLQLDKMSELGGTFLISEGTTSGADTKLQFEAGIYDDSPYAFYKDCMKESRAREVCDSEVLMFYCQHSGEAVDWLDSLGAYTGDERQPIEPIYGEIWEFKRTFWASSALKYLNVILTEHEKRVKRGDIEMVLNTRITKLLQEEGKINRGIGVVAKGTPKVMVFIHPFSDPSVTHMMEEVGLAPATTVFMIPPAKRNPSLTFNTLGEERAEAAMRDGAYHSTFGIAKRFEDAVNSMDIDGVIWGYLYNCRPSALGSHLIKNWIEERTGVPTLSLEMDIYDSRSYGAAALRTRVEAFAELLNARKAVRT